MASSNDPGFTTLRRDLYIAVESRLCLIDPITVSIFRSYQLLVAQEVTNALEESTAFRQLTQSTTRRQLTDFHTAHAAFLTGALELKSERCLVESLIWGYRTMVARGLSSSALRLMLEVWPETIRRQLRHRTDTRHLEGLYEAILHRHDKLMEAVNAPEPELDVPVHFRAPFDSFCRALLDAKPREAQALVLDNISSAAEVPVWWQEVVAPALHRIGRLWAIAEIDEAQEHIATAIAHRVMASAFPRLPRPAPRNQTVAVVVSPGEIHDIGASMVRDTLELAGFDVLFTGASTPADTVVPLVANNDVVCTLVSTTLAPNLTGTSSLIRNLTDARTPTPVIVGGQAYRWDKNLWRKTGASAYENSLLGVLQRMDELVQS